MDILFFAVLAFFIFFKLNKQLGKIDEEEQKTITAKIAQKKKQLREVQNQIISQAKQKLKEGVESTQEQIEELSSKLDNNSKSQFAQILEESNITIDFFITGVKSAFEMILKAFVEADLKTLELLLSPKIFKSFEAAVNDRKSKSQNLVTNLIAIEKVEIIAANLEGSIANITAKISSKQINYITDSASEVIEGRKDEITPITDIWTFQRDVTANNPNWIVVTTGAH